MLCSALLGWRDRLLLLLLLIVPAVASAERVISLGGDVTELVYALGAGDRLIGRDTTSQYPQAALDLPDVGYLRQLSLEGILSLRPDLVLLSDAARPAPLAERLAAAGVRVVRVPHQQDLAGVEHKIHVIAEALSRQAAGVELIRAFQQDVARLQQATQEHAGWQAVFILNHGGMGAPLVAGQGSSAAQMLDLAGVDNAAAALQGYRPLSAEGLIQARPEVVIVTEAGLRALGGEAGLWRLPGVRQTPAGRAGRYLVVDDLAFLGFGPRTPDELVRLRQALMAFSSS